VAATLFDPPTQIHSWCVSLRLLTEDPEGSPPRQSGRPRRIRKPDTTQDALQHEAGREESAPAPIERGIEFTRALRARADPATNRVVDKAFIDSLYGED